MIKHKLYKWSYTFNTDDDREIVWLDAKEHETQKRYHESETNELDMQFDGVYEVTKSE
jgi:hypothetical protein